MRAMGSRSLATLVVVLGLVAPGCRDGGLERGEADIAVTNSYLQCAVEDLNGAAAKVLCLAPPGMCPGHFDLSPAQVRDLQGCRVLLLFDFQQQVEQRLARLRKGGLETHLIRTPAGLCVPDTYVSACEQVCRILSDEYPERAGRLQQRLSAIRQRLQRLGTELHEAIAEADAVSANVLSSNHQADFVSWLGLKPIATFIGSDIETVSNVDHCIRKAAGQDVRVVIANRQEGTALAEALAERLQATAVVFDNFPQAVNGAPGFDRLVRDNVGALLEAVTP